MEILYNEETDIYTAIFCHTCKNGNNLEIVCMDTDKEKAIELVNKEYEISSATCAIWSQNVR